MQQIIIRFKVLLQELRKYLLECEEEVSDKLCKVWEVNLKELQEIGENELSGRLDDGDEKDHVVSKELH